MGGYGSGRRWGSSKNTTSACYRLDVRWLAREGLLAPGRFSTVRWTRNGEETGSIGVQADLDHINLRYRRLSNGEWKDAEYPVALDWTPCNYRGTRPWFLCPIRGCGRRVAVLYGGGVYACRHCHQLAYESQNERPYSRALSRAQAIIEEKLGGKWADGVPEKPKGMHLRTYWKLAREYENAMSNSWPPWLLKGDKRQQ